MSGVSGNPTQIFLNTRQRIQDPSKNQIPGAQYSSLDRCFLCKHVNIHLLLYDQGTTLTPIDLACEMTLLHNPSRLDPVRRGSLCLIFAISYMCLRETVPITSVPGFCAPFSLPLVSLIPAACSSSQAVVGVRSSNVKDLSGRTITLAGMGTPGLK